MSQAGRDRDSSRNGRKRNLPSWMGSRKDASNVDGNKRAHAGDQEGSEEGETSKVSKNHSKIQNAEVETEPNSDLGTSNFSKLMEGVVFVLSGFINPERSTLRSQALEMGAEFQPDWNSNCTLLVCAFHNTPKFRQVEADLGTIVSKDWIAECYNQRQLIGIEPYLMHAGKPWRKQSVCKDQRPSTSRKSQKRVESSRSDMSTPASSKDTHSNGVKECFSPSKVKKWAIDDLQSTISWLESQDEKPEPTEIKKIAAEGILTCLQDTIDSLKQGQDVKRITEEWACIPRAVEELAKFQGTKSRLTMVQKEDLCKQAVSCKQIYEREFKNKDLFLKMKEPNTGSDSDETIEMTEQEIDQAYNAVSSTLQTVN
ncbi:PREDICTED: DNA-repair protein XRCC1 [Ipomoea nil]|uniref:DNA-repair protein XRCC1 n=1 Tax=Ipomoea nil TaxID=35883 RepID=UPI0009012872|nr:PREDICTED: DNA-repair protein XRCC1 [Ipomoea nil]